MIYRMPLVAIRCLTYNHGPYIRQCLEGFVMQKTNFPFIAIVHDDASTDNTADIIREYEVKYPDIIKPIYETENQYSKPDGSLGRIMAQAVPDSVKYIALCEGDDYWVDPLKLQKQVDFLEQNLFYSMCFHNAIILYQDENKVQLFNHWCEDHDLDYESAVADWIVPTASIVVRKQILDSSLDLPKMYGGDYSLILKCLFFGRVRFISSISSFYRKTYFGSSASALMKGKNVLMLSQKIKFLEEFEKKDICADFRAAITNYLKYLNKELLFQKARESKDVVKLIVMLPFAIKKCVKKIKSRI